MNAWNVSGCATRFSEIEAQSNLRHSSDVHQSLVGIAPAGKFAVTCARGLLTGVLLHSVGTAPPVGVPSA